VSSTNFSDEKFHLDYKTNIPNVTSDLVLALISGDSSTQPTLAFTSSTASDGYIAVSTTFSNASSTDGKQWVYNVKSTAFPLIDFNITIIQTAAKIKFDILSITGDENITYLPTMIRGTLLVSNAQTDYESTIRHPLINNTHTLTARIRVLKGQTMDAGITITSDHINGYEYQSGVPVSATYDNIAASGTTFTEEPATLNNGTLILQSSDTQYDYYTVKLQGIGTPTASGYNYFKFTGDGIALSGPNADVGQPVYSMEDAT
jgi:hypothetical protein